MATVNHHSFEKAIEFVQRWCQEPTIQEMPRNIEDCARQCNCSINPPTIENNGVRMRTNRIITTRYCNFQMSNKECVEWFKLETRWFEQVKNKKIAALTIQAQWWSNRAIHLLQILQCFDRAGLYWHRSHSNIQKSCKVLIYEVSGPKTDSFSSVPTSRMLHTQLVRDD